MREIKLPFQLGPDGTIATVNEESGIIDQHVRVLISTATGERVMVPTYGLDLAGLIYGNNDPVLLNVIQNDVINAFQRWEPSIQLTNVNPAQSTDAQQGIAAVDVEYTPTSVNAVGTATTPIYQTATMSVGGTVIND
jgi:hypothetical protein